MFPSDLAVVFPDLVVNQGYVLENISEAGQRLRYFESPMAPAAASAGALSGIFRQDSYQHGWGQQGLDLGQRPRGLGRCNGIRFVTIMEDFT